MNATSDGAAGGDAGSNPFAALFQPPAGSAAESAATSAPPTSGAPNSAPLPNPWAPPAASAAPPATSGVHAFREGAARQEEPGAGQAGQ